MLYYEGLDEVLDDQLDIDDLIVSIKTVLYVIIIVSLVAMIIFQQFTELHIFYLMCKLHHLEFKRVRMQMFVVVVSQIFFYIFSFIFINEWYTSVVTNQEFFTYWTVACKLETIDVVEVFMFWIF